MPYLYIFAFVLAILIVIGHVSDFKWEVKLVNSSLFLFFLAFGVRVLASFISDGFPNDIQDFKDWSDILYKDGFSGFYSSNVFVDYPPGYMYVLYVLGFIKDFFGINGDFACTFLIKLPPIIFDCLTSVFIYKLAKDNFTKTQAWFAGLLFAVNPVFIVTSSLWGQADAVYIFFLTVSIYYLGKNNLMPAYSFYAAALLIKPQAFMFAPLYIYSVYEYFAVKAKGNGKSFLNNITSFLDNVWVPIFIILAGSLPFTSGFNFYPIIRRYIDAFVSYSHATVNAANFYSLIGKNWSALESDPHSIFLMAVSIASILCAVICSFYILKRSAPRFGYFFSAGLINVIVFIFSVKMHERYVLPAVIFLIASYLVNRDKRLLTISLGFSLTAFVNCAMTLDTYILEKDVFLMSEPLAVLSAVNLFLTGMLVYTAMTDKNMAAYSPDSGFYPDNTMPSGRETGYMDFVPEKTKAFKPFTKFDKYILVFLTIATSVLSFSALGDMTAPQSLWEAKNASPAVMQFRDDVYIGKMLYYVGISPDKKFLVSTSEDGVIWEEGPEIVTSGVFSWKESEIGTYAKYIKISPVDSELTLFEIGFRDKNGGFVEIVSGSAPLLFDEQFTVPATSTYMNSTYFDEIYHARTAYEMLNGIKIYENTHPPLGKAIISIGIYLFGMTPFGWRIMGTLFGVLLVPLIYMFAKRLFKDSKWALFAALLIMFDFMRYTQTRIATIDTYITFFVILMYYFMYKYYCMNFYDTDFKKTLKPLFLSGLFMGIGIACKWPGVYAGAGLAVIFFIVMYRRFMEYRYISYNSDSKIIREKFPRYFFSTIAWCVLFFVVIPLAVYAISYLTYFGTPGYGGIGDIINNQTSMFNYHSKLESTHPYGSEWWKWPILARPVFYYSKTFSQDLKAGISAFGNPAVWWFGIIAFVYSIYAATKQKDKTALFILIGYLAQYLPWTLISRTTYMYHYFPSIPFVIFMITLMFKKYISFKNKRLIYIYLGVVIVLFLMFFPVISGMPIAPWYVEKILRWLPGWQLII